MRQSCNRLLFGLAMLAASISAAAAQAQSDWVALAKPGTHAIMRHAQAPGTGDPENFLLGDCSTQRNLNEAGRLQARQIGRAIDEAGVVVTRVLTSQWCRAAETATLLDVAPVVEEPALNSFFEDRAGEAAQTAGLRQLLAAATAEEKLVLVTHQVNITALTGIVPAPGEVLVIALGESGTVDVVERIATETP